MRDTVSQVLTASAQEVGLVPPADPFASTDAEFSRLRALLQLAGDEMCALADWPFLARQHTLTTVENADAATPHQGYPLPAGYQRINTRTQFDISNDWRAHGPLSPEEWAELNAFDYSSPYFGWRIYQDRFRLWPDSHPAGVEIRFEYQSDLWVNPEGTPARRFTAGNDVIGFDSRLARLLLTVKYKAAKGLDATPWVEAFGSLLKEISGDLIAARPLRLDGSHWPGTLHRYGQFREGGIGVR